VVVELVPHGKPFLRVPERGAHVVQRHLQHTYVISPPTHIHQDGILIAHYLTAVKPTHPCTCGTPDYHQLNGVNEHGHIERALHNCGQSWIEEWRFAKGLCTGNPACTPEAPSAPTVHPPWCGPRPSTPAACPSRTSSGLHSTTIDLECGMLASSTRQCQDSAVHSLSALGWHLGLGSGPASYLAWLEVASSTLCYPG
jgi:hypothetical protein